MPFWDGPFTMIPAFEASTDAGETFRTSDRRQFRHLAIVFADRPTWPVTDLAGRMEEILESGGDLVIVAPPGPDWNLPDDVQVVRDADGSITERYRAIVPEWHPPMVFVADRYGEITAVTDAMDPDMPENVVQWVFSNEVQCAL